jgi:hypothetical protein
MDLQKTLLYIRADLYGIDALFHEVFLVLWSSLLDNEFLFGIHHLT